MADVVTNVQDGQAANSSARNVTTDGLAGMQNLAGQFGNMGTVIAIVLIIGLLIGGFAVFGRRT